ncbi:LacI family DNA-binding transcriptional regulator [Nesterenkonia flava]|uniref:LacI family DNA-binding transcriptional regulator n=1 Tax=Nesterenkonia flava TaxID=469799 RepID=A0ABU1FU99_9MICC|nr:LacI family DNA-binding transcriptional regulator [Nesterenkonia flava]MDR5712239.1 LacI family DNA-binding transcriptional regulator [Nesterenkonia flava]
MTEHGKRNMTQRGLAALAGVSVPTVSRVLSAPADQRTRWASATTVEKILSLAEEHGYTRNPHAASLRTARSNLVGVMVPRLQDLVLATIYEGIEEAGVEHGVNTYVMNSHDDVDLQRTRTQAMLERRVDGLIFGDAHLDDDFLENLAQRHVPFVLTSRRKDGHISVTLDDYAGGRLVAQHLADLGCRSIVVLAGLEFASTAQDRTQGLIDGLSDAGIEVPEKNIIFRGFDTMAGRLAMAEVLETGLEPDAVFATNDFAAIGALGVLQDQGRSVPDDVVLVGYNDTPLAESVGIPLTTVHSPMHQMGRQALETLMRLIAGEDCEPVLLEPELIIRSSTQR